MKSRNLVPLMLLLLGCDPPRLEKISVDPRYFCDGDKISVSWKTGNIKNVRLVDKNGDTLKDASGNNLEAAGNDFTGTFTADRNQMPLDLVGYYDKKDRSLRSFNPFLADFLLWTKNVDNEYWTDPFKYDTKNSLSGTGTTMPPGMPYTFQRTVKKDTRQEPIGTPTTIDCIPVQGPVISNGATQTVVNQFDALEAVAWDLQSTLFSNRCKAIAVENCTNENVKVEFDGEVLSLPSNSSKNFVTNHIPRGILRFVLDSPKEVLARTSTRVLPDNCRGNGTVRQCTDQTGLPTECPEVMPFGCMKLQVRCDLP